MTHPQEGVVSFHFDAVRFVSRYQGEDGRAPRGGEGEVAVRRVLRDEVSCFFCRVLAAWYRGALLFRWPVCQCSGAVPCLVLLWCTNMLSGSKLGCSALKFCFGIHLRVGRLLENLVCSFQQSGPPVGVWSLSFHTSTNQRFDAPQKIRKYSVPQERSTRDVADTLLKSGNCVHLSNLLSSTVTWFPPSRTPQQVAPVARSMHAPISSIHVL